MSRTFRSIVWVVAMVVLALVFATYLQPDFMVQLAGQIWACW